MDIVIRRYEEKDKTELSEMIVKTLNVSNIKDYTREQIDTLSKELAPDKLSERAKQGHFYVACDDGRIVGCGCISPFWGSITESILLTIFVLPQYQGNGIGRRIILTLEQDEYALRAKRIEIPASVTGVEFYRKMGYDYKNGVKELDDELLYRLEKFL